MEKESPYFIGKLLNNFILFQLIYANSYIPVNPTICASHPTYCFSGSTFKHVVFGDIK